MTRRSGIIAAVAGILPILSAMGQKKDGDGLISSIPANPFVTFGMAPDQITIGWDLATMELFVKTDGKEIRVSKDEILVALAKEEKDA